MSHYEIKRLGRSKFKYVSEGAGEPLLLLHGLMGGLSNFTAVIEYFKTRYQVFLPILPLYDLDLAYTTVGGMKKFLKRFVTKLGLEKVHIVGNSLGGHIALLYALDKKEAHKIASLTLTGSSGLFENGLGDTYPKRNNYEYIRMKAQSTFYDPAVATKALVDEVFEIVSNRIKALKIIYMAKSAMRNYLGEKLQLVKTPTLLVWGKNDIVTPPLVAEEFHKLLENSELCFLDKCGHAPMMEKPQEFNEALLTFLQKHPL